MKKIQTNRKGKEKQKVKKKFVGRKEKTWVEKKKRL